MIYCVEDDDGICGLMVYTLKASGFDAAGFPTAEALFTALKESTPQLILLDIMLPDKDGISILKELKSSVFTRDIPVIMATAKGTEYDKVIGLDLGADDYLAKPFGMMEMVSRVKAVLRRAPSGQKTPVLSIGGLTLNPAEHTVFANGNEVILTYKEFSLLCVFLENPGIVFSRDQLFARVWGSEITLETRTVDVHIQTLRAKLSDCGQYIKTVRGVGYRLEAGYDKTNL